MHTLSAYGEICFDSLEFDPVGGCWSVSLLDFLELFERYFLGVYLAEGMLHVVFEFGPCQVDSPFLV